MTLVVGNNGSVATTFDVTLYLSADEVPETIEKVGDLWYRRPLRSTKHGRLRFLSVSRLSRPWAITSGSPRSTLPTGSLRWMRETTLG